MPVRDSTLVQEEKITLRLPSATVTFPNLDKIGMRPEHLQLIRKALTMDNGIIIDAYWFGQNHHAVRRHPGWTANALM